MKKRRLSIFVAISIAAAVAWYAKCQATHDGVTLTPVWFPEPLPLPGAIPFPESSPTFSVLDVLQKTCSAPDWETYISYHTPESIPRIKFSEGAGREGWEKTKHLRANGKFSICGIEFLSHGYKNHAFVSSVPANVKPEDRPTLGIQLDVLVYDPVKGWRIDIPVSNSPLYLYMMIDLHKKYLVTGKKEEFRKLEPAIQEIYRRSVVLKEEGWYHLPAGSNEAGWVEWGRRPPASTTTASRD